MEGGDDEAIEAGREAVPGTYVLEPLFNNWRELLGIDMNTEF